MLGHPDRPNRVFLLPRCWSRLLSRFRIHALSIVWGCTSVNPQKTLSKSKKMWVLVLHWVDTRL